MNNPISPRLSKAKQSISSLQSRSSLTDLKVQAVIELIHADLRQNYSLEELSRHVNLSPWWLCHLFSTQTGMSPCQYQKLVRMQRAAELLVTTFLCVKEVMSQISVNDLSHFKRDFKQSYGLSPSQYRQRYHEVRHREAAEADSKIGH
jgi:transcriptional regulator GlxA family with amidase domain